MFKKFIHGVLIGLMAALVALGFLSLGWLNGLEAKTWDLRVRLLAKPVATTQEIRLILIDQSSLDWAQQENRLGWPWPREVYAPILSFCRRAGAKAVIFDIFFTEPSIYGVYDDEEFGTAIAETKGFVQAFFPSNEQGTTTNWPAYLNQKVLSVSGLDRYLSTPRSEWLTMSRASFPVREVATNAFLLGTAYAVSDDTDAIIRRALLFQVFDGHFVPSLGLAAFLSAHPNVSLSIEENVLHAGTHGIPLDTEGRTILRYRGPTQTHQAKNAAAVIQSELRIIEGNEPVIDPSFFQNAYVFVGTTAPALLDLKPTPISEVYPGVEIHATILDNLLSNDFMRDAGRGPMVLFTLAFALVSGLAGRACQKEWQAVLTFVGLLPLPFLAGFLAYRQGIWLPIVVEEVAVAVALVGSLIANYAIEGRQKRFIQGAFKQYLSPDVIDKLIENPDQLRLGGESRELSIFFSDVQGFTSISERLTPEELTALLNDYLSAMTDIILNEGGTVDKYEGDAIIAFWNAPLDLDDHPQRAVRAALHCQRKLADLRPVFRERVGKDIFARIGINTGPGVVGNMGSHQRFDYTFLGDAGNLASRLEGINKQFGTPIMISESTFTQLGDDMAAREISRVKVVGRAQAVKVYEPMFKDDFSSRIPVINIFTRGLRAYYDGHFEEALKAFSEISGQDPVSRAYEQRCKDLLKTPPKEWDGIWEMTEK